MPIIKWNRILTLVLGRDREPLILLLLTIVLVEPDETIILRAVSQDPSKLVGESSTTLTIEDNEPVISLWTTSMGSRIVRTEGDGSVTLQLDANRLTASSLTVNLLYRDAGAITGDHPSVDTPDISTMVTVATETTTRHTFEIDITEDKIAGEFNRSVFVVLQEGDGYTRSDTNNMVEVVVQDNDFAEVYFSQDAGTVTEGEDIVFIIIKDLMTAAETPVDIEFIPTGKFFKTTPMTTQVNFPAGVAMSTAKITISTVDDKDIEADGSLMASIVIIPGSPLRPGGVGRADKRIVTILNDDVPAVISFERPGYVIFEDTTGTITLRADPRPGDKNPD